MDGNPNAGAETVREALARGRDAGARALPRGGARAGRRARADDDARRGLRRAPRVDRARRARAPDLRGARSASRTATSRTAASSPSSGGGSATTATGGAEELQADLDVIDRSLRANEGARIADGRLADLRRRVELFGFHVAKLDVRFHAAELAERSARVAEALGAVAEAQGRLGERAVDTVIVSGTESAADVLAARRPRR